MSARTGSQPVRAESITHVAGINRAQCHDCGVCVAALEEGRCCTAEARECRAWSGDTILIPQQRRFLYGDDGAATRRVGAARTTLRRRARRIAQRAASDRVARLSGRAGTNTARRATAVSACASDCIPGASGTSATKAVRSRGRVVSLAFRPTSDITTWNSSMMRHVGSNR
jgi:hypothetical protein